MTDNLIITNADKILKAMQQIELDSLEEFDRICRKYDIKYSLGGGTNLGQVRHGGFIPWDDDIDVDMTIENYDKFMAVALKELDSDKYFLRCRATDPKHLRSMARLERKGTRLSKAVWDRRGEEAGVFVDIFRWSYMPNNKVLRRIVTSLLFFIRGVENNKEFGTIPAKLSMKAHFPLMIICSLMTPKAMMRIDDKLCKCCGNRKTDWIIDDAVINGNHGGYPAQGIDEYEDVQFENLTVMAKKNSSNFLRILYGEHFNEWLPPVKRISHHNWTKVDFGEYAKEFDLPDNYEEYLFTYYTPRKLRRMKQLTDVMLKDIAEICEKYGLDYFKVEYDRESEDEFKEKFGDLWTEPAKIAILREDYEKFSEVCQQELGEKYFYQTSETDPVFRYAHGRVRLNYTYFRERRIPPSYDYFMDTGFFVEIVPLDATSDDKSLREKHLKKLRRKNTFISLRWRKARPKQFLKSGMKNKLKIMMLLPFSKETVSRWTAKEQARYRSKSGDYCIDGTAYELDGLIAKVDQLRADKKIVLQSRDPVPADEDELLAQIHRRFGTCHLTYFDDPDYQFTMLRYDEKTGKILTNKELLGYE